MNFFKKKYLFVYRSAWLLVLLFVHLSCTKGLQKETVVYKNDFEKGTLKNINNGKIETYQGTKVLGRYAVGGFSFHIDSLPRHDLLQLSFDLYIHDNWEGNAADGSISGSDVWIMNIFGQNTMYTTFSNKICSGLNCKYQGYPGTYPFVNNPPRSNAMDVDLPGACSTQGNTTKYHFVRTMGYTGDSFVFDCACQFSQGSKNDPCNKSWSIDNLQVKIIQLR